MPISEVAERDVLFKAHGLQGLLGGAQTRLRAQ